MTNIEQTATGVN